MSRLYAGTSGFAYPAWKPDFYPPKLPAKKFLEHYATRLNCVEVNYTFRQLPSAKTLEAWVAATPAHFLFAPKAHMRLTHILRLKNAAEFTEVFLRAIDPLRTARRLAPILFQLPPNFKCEPATLDAYLRLLPRDLHYAFEFRNETWLCPEIYDTLRRHNAALCVAESDTLEVPEVTTADFVYYRLRKSGYSPDQRETVAERARQVLDSGKNLYLFYKHEDDPHGALYAEELLARF